MKRSIEAATVDPRHVLQGKLDAAQRIEGQLHDSIHTINRQTSHVRQLTAHAVFGIHRLADLTEAITAPLAKREEEQGSWSPPRSGGGVVAYPDTQRKVKSLASTVDPPPLLGSALWNAVLDAHRVLESYADEVLQAFTS
eukprot:CAMPEP_0176451478 /NCGR_PEP_ID=MMETSP0127-20121128/27867_1 /TAXON_ID=938130 /ORGANISM="Platyophrya macrostoma, Strain WH" /LENGTH=139 /DNA_ID=CAMNT_0017839555 /DNA_START=111 /DNA_END=526 /DNA_ORIENTATION=-